MKSHVFSLCLAASCLANAQVQDAPIAGEIKFAGTFNTHKFFPQINNVKPLPFEQEWETEPRWYMQQGPPNSLKFDSVTPLPARIERELYGESIKGLTQVSFDPADPDLAVGPRHIVQVVNSQLMFIEKATGKNLFQQVMDDVPGDGTTIFEPFIDADSLMFDPRTWYDANAKRFFMTIMEKNTAKKISKIHLAFSDDADPMGSWSVFSADVKKVNNTVSYWADYNTAGYNKDAIVLPYLLFNFVGDKFLSSRILIIRKDPLLKGESQSTQTFEQAGIYTIQAMRGDDNVVDKVYGVHRKDSTTLRLYAFSNLTGIPKMNFKDIPVPTATSLSARPARARNNRRLDPGPDRVLSAYYRNGALYTAQSTPVVHQNGTYNVGISFYVINTNSYPAKNPTLGQSGLTYPTGADWTYPTIAVNADEDVAIVATESSATKNPIPVLVGRKKADTKGQLPKVSAMGGENTTDYKSAAQQRWGDYFGVAVDPGDRRTFWGTTMTPNGANWDSLVFAHSYRGTDFRYAYPSTYWKNQGASVTGNVASLQTSNAVGLVMKPSLINTAYVSSVDLNVKMPLALTRQRSLGVEMLTRGTDQTEITLWILDNKLWKYEKVGTFYNKVGDLVTKKFNLPAPLEDYVNSAGYATFNVQAYKKANQTITLDMFKMEYAFHKS